MEQYKKYVNYIGAKLIKARRMTKDGKDGYEVAYPDIMTGEIGYVSWSPKEVFEQAYTELPESHVNFLK